MFLKGSESSKGSEGYNENKSLKSEYVYIGIFEQVEHLQKMEITS